jgi:hypothetical protein
MAAQSYAGAKQIWKSAIDFRFNGCITLTSCARFICRRCLDAGAAKKAQSTMFVIGYDSFHRQSGWHLMPVDCEPVSGLA